MSAAASAGSGTWAARADKRPAWYEGVPPVTVEVVCGGQAHRLSWRRGKLVLEDHDLSGELALVALGGGSCACLDFLRVWAQGSRDLHSVYWLRGQPTLPSPLPSARRVFVPGSSLPAPPARSLSQLNERHRQQLQATLARRERARLLWSLPPELHVRMALSAVMRAERAHSLSPLKDPGPLDEALRSLAGGAVRQLVRAAPGAPAGARLDLDFSSVDPDRTPWAEGDVDDYGASLALGLPWSWLARVWAWGLAVLEDSFVLAVTGHGAGGPAAVRVLCARWEPDEMGGATLVTEPAEAVLGPAGWRKARGAAGGGGGEDGAGGGQAMSLAGDPRQ